MYFSVKKLIHHPRKRLYNLIKTCNIKKKEGEKKEKECRSHASFKEAEFNDKVEFLGASWAEDFVCLMEFPWEWPQNLSIRSQPCTFEAWLGFFDLLAISLFDVSSYLFSTRKIYTVKKNLSYGNPFSRRSFFHCYAQVSIHLRGNIDCRNECQNKTTSCSRFLSYFRVQIFSILPVYNLEQVTSISIISNGFY